MSEVTKTYRACDFCGFDIEKIFGDERAYTWGDKDICGDCYDILIIAQKVGLVYSDLLCEPWLKLRIDDSGGD